MGFSGLTAFSDICIKLVWLNVGRAFWILCDDFTYVYQDFSGLTSFSKSSFQSASSMSHYFFYSKTSVVLELKPQNENDIFIITCSNPLAKFLCPISMHLCYAGLRGISFSGKSTSSRKYNYSSEQTTMTTQSIGLLMYLGQQTKK